MPSELHTMITKQHSHPFAVTRAGVFAIVWPVMFASISVPLMGFTDMAVVGRLTDAALLGGLAIAAIIFDFIFVGFNFLRASTTGLTAQALGAKDTPEQGAVLLRAMLLSVVIGLPIIALSDGILKIGLNLMNPSEAVGQAMAIYFSIRIFSAPFTLLNYSMLGWLLGLGKARLGLALLVVLSGSNIVLSIYLGLIKNGGIAGVAWASLIAEVLATVLGLLIVYRIGTNWPKLSVIINKDKIKRTLSINSDIMIRSFLLVFAFSFFTAQGSRFGDITLAANAILLNFLMLSAFMLDGFATATEQLVGRAIGAHYCPAFKQTIRIAGFWSSLLAVFLFISFMLLGPYIIDILSTHEDIRSTAKTYLFWAALTSIFGALAFLMDGVYIGATWTREMRNTMLISTLIFLLASWLLMPRWQNHGLWLALEILLAVRGLNLLYHLRKKRQQQFGE